MDISLLVKLTARAWSLDILALLHSGTPGRQAPLIAASGAGRTAFGQSLAHLMDLGLVVRNPGHGHPLRPEFRLTETGERVAARAAALYNLAPSDPAARQLLRRSWSLPILAVTPRPIAFSGIRTRLPGVTDRALSLSLKKLEAQDWLARRVDTAARPPRPYYQAQGLGGDIAQRLMRSSGIDAV